MKIDDKTLLECFEEGFRTRCAGCVRDCDCGRVFYNPSSDWTWEDGELEALKANPKATGLDYAVETVSFEGRECVLDCTCWQERAKKIATFLIFHGEAIAEFLTVLKKHLHDAATNAPVVR